MKKAAVIIAPGFEEGEALTIIDIMRRAGITCDSVGLTQTVVTGAHHITIGCDKVLSKEICDYDMVVLPGGIPGATNLRDSDLLMEVVREMNREGKYVCAMCAAPIALERAGVLEGKIFTAYVGYDQKIKAGTFSDREVVTDGNVVTSRGPATAYAFAYELAGLLGGDVEAVKQRMLYDHAFKKEGARDRRDWPRIWLISGRKNSCPAYAAKVLDFQSLQDQASHPYQLLYVARLIAQEYGRELEA